MSVIGKIEAKDDTVKSQLPRFILVGGVSTVINYITFFVLYTIFAVNYSIAAAAGYIVGALFGYVFNARLTFRSRTGFSILPYFIVYTASLVGSLGILGFQVTSLKISPLFANVISIGFSTVTNFLGTKYVVFNRNFKLPKFFRSKLFISVLLLKIVIAAFFASDYILHLFVPFVKYFIENPLANPYQHFFDLGAKNIFPYPPFMLFVLSVPHILLYAFKSPSTMFDVFVTRISLLLSDVAIFYALYRLFPKREKLTMLLYWCSPIVFYITYIHGQLDIVPVALLFLSAYFLTNKKMLPSALFLALGIATKSYIIVVIPIYIIFLAKRKYGLSKMAKFFLFAGLVDAIIFLPYIFSSGFINLVLFAPEQYRVFSLSVNFTTTLAFYVLPAAYAFIIFKAYNFKKITTDVLFVFLGLLLTVLVTFLTPERGWYLWPIPFIVYFLIKEERLNKWSYAAFNVFYLLYFIFVQDSDVFHVFQIISPSIANFQTPYNYLSMFNISARTIVNLLFTALATSLLYTIYIIYKKGVKGSLVFQEQNGVPTIGIAGDSGTGKTTFAESLSSFFGNNNTTLVHGDDVHKWERGDKRWSYLTHLNPASNFVHNHYNQIMLLKNGRSIKRKLYDHKTGKFTDPVVIKPRNIIISEGLHTLFINESNSLYTLKVYLDPDSSLRFLWKIRRDVGERNYSIKQVLDSLKRREKDSKKFISPQKYYSDIVISQNPIDKINFKKPYKDIQTYIEVYIKNDIPIEQLVSACLQSKTLNADLEYPDHRFQKVSIYGNITKQGLHNIIRSLELPYDEYDVEIGNLKDGFEGLTQLLILFCLNEKLKKSSRSDENDG